MSDGITQEAILQDRVDQLIRAHRVRGHMVAQLDPLNQRKVPAPELEPDFYGLTEADLDREVSSRVVTGPSRQTLRELLRRLRNTYCRSIGVQFMHIDDLDIRHWLQDRMEGTENRLSLSRTQQFRILTSLTKAVVFEQALRTKYVGAKTFSLEGCESLIPLLDLAIERAGEHGINEIVIGMAHRGRLNVLANILDKRPADIFREFDDRAGGGHAGRGDVVHHLGHSSDWKTASGRSIHLSLCFNPSHLEFINPVALGRMRAKQDRVGDLARETGMVLLIHGDAAFIGQGVVAETLNLSELEGYTVGGTLHVVVNNQIGFTTSPLEARSSIYATDVAKMLQIPIFHVNGEDPEAVAQVIQVGMDFRKQFMRDVVIDMYGYRRHGHNEMDEPSFTQPNLYKAIRERKSVRDGYLDHLLQLGEISQEQADSVAEAFEEELAEGLAHARSDSYVEPSLARAGAWSDYAGGRDDSAEEVATGVPKETQIELLKRLLAVPDGFHTHPRLSRFFSHRQAMIDEKEKLDWSAAEALAFASLAAHGVRVRLSGQDSQRGTFGHRHSVLHCHETGRTWCPLQHLALQQGAVEIINSPLSEAGVLGFEYGYSLDAPEALVMWEAQFGDFFNGAQVYIDQFLVSAEVKWRRLSGLVLLLPHGQDGQGPEHSSARIERFLLLAAEENIQVVQPTTPAQLFHLLRRQVLRRWRKPLVVFTPKSLLRHEAVRSSFDDLANGRFMPVISDPDSPGSDVTRILLCNGKVYYELLEAREKAGRRDIAIIRLEQLYPLRLADLEAALASFKTETPAIWVQEEPLNMGAWKQMYFRFGRRLLDRFPFDVVSRPESASPATGSHSLHKLEQERLIAEALG